MYLSDEAIVALYFARDEAAIGHTADKYGRYCYAIAHRILHSTEDAEECVNDTYLRTWDTIPPSRPTYLSLFLAKIVRNLSLDRYKAGRTRKRGGGELPLLLGELGECIAAGEDVQKQMEEKELARFIGAYLQTVPERDRRLFVRRYFYAMSVSEAAEAEHLTENHASKILSRMRERIRDRLREEGLTE